MSAYRLPILRPVKELEGRVRADAYGINPTQYDEMPGTTATPYSGDIGFGALPEPPRAQPQQAPDYTNMAPGYNPGLPTSLPQPPQPVQPNYGSIGPQQWEGYGAAAPNLGVYQPEPEPAPEPMPGFDFFVEGFKAGMENVPVIQGARQVGEFLGEPFKNTVYPYLLGGDDPETAQRKAREYSGARLEEREASQQRQDLGSFLEPALDYPGLQQLGYAGALKPSIEAGLRLGGRAIGEAAETGARIAGDVAGTGKLRFGQLAADEAGAVRVGKGGGESLDSLMAKYLKDVEANNEIIAPFRSKPISELTDDELWTAYMNGRGWYTSNNAPTRSSGDRVINATLDEAQRRGMDLYNMKSRPSTTGMKTPDLATAPVPEVIAPKAARPAEVPPIEPPKPPTAAGGPPMPEDPGVPKFKFGAVRIGGLPRVNLDPAQGAQLSKLESALTPEAKTAWQKVVDAKDSVVRATLDKNAPLAKLGKMTGLPVHQQAQVVPGARAYGEDIIRKEIEPVIAPLGKDIAILERYMVLKRNEDLLARNPDAVLPGGVTDTATALQGLEAVVGPERFAAVENAANTLWDVDRRYILEPLRDNGIISPESFDAITTANPHYIDWHRLDAALDVPTGTGAGQVASLGSTGIKKLLLEGSERKLDQPLAKTIAQIVTTQERVSRNKAATTLFDALDSLGLATVKTEAGPAALGNGTMSFFKNGEKIVAEVPQVYADVAKGLEAETAGLVGNMLTKLAQPLRTGATTYNPAFVIVNPIRDFITAGFNQGWRTVVGPEYIQGWIAALTKNEAFSDAAKDGALMSGIIDSFRSTEDLTKIAGRRAAGIQLDSVGDVAKFVPRLIREMNTASERATRIGTYLRLKNKGATDLDAAVGARNVTVDFSKSGNAVKVLNQAIPFLNAGIQGASNTLAVMFKRGTVAQRVKNTIARSVPPVAVSVLFDRANQDYESASLIPDYEYRNNWVLIYGEGKTEPDPKTGEVKAYPMYIKIPKGPTGALLTIPAEMLLKWNRAKGQYSVGDDLIGTVGALGETLSPVSISPSSLMLPGVGTIGELAANKDLYTGREIVPAREKNRPAELQYGPETSRAAVALGGLTKRSPRQFDYAIKDYAAGTGQAASFVLDKALGAAGYNPPVPGEATAQRKTGEQSLSQMPVVSRFMGVRNTEPERQAYEQLRQVTEQTQRRMSKEYPSTVRLGVNLGQVGDSFSRKGKTVYFTPEEQAGLQKSSYEAMKPYLDMVVNEPGFKAKYSLEDQRKLIQKAMSRGREEAVADLIGNMSNDEITRRIQLAASAPLRLGAGR